MGKGKRVTCIILFGILVALVVASACYFLVLPTFAIVTDSAWEQCFSLRQTLDLRVGYALKGYRLRFVKLSDNDLYDVRLLQSDLQRLRCRSVLLSPVVTSYAVQNRMDVSALMPQSIVMGLGNASPELFDALLVSDERSGWIGCAQSVADQTAKLSSNVALIFESDVIDYSKDMVAYFPSGGVNCYDAMDAGRLFPSNTLDEMDRLGIVLALCPYVGDLGPFFQNPNTVSWIVDYRFRPAVPDANLYGVVAPDFLGLVELSQEIGKGDGMMLELEYVYEKL